MSWLFVVLAFGQFADVYLPHKPLDVESGALVGTLSSELRLAYRVQSPSPDFSSPVTTSFLHSPDGYNEVGVNLPWLRVWDAADTAYHIYIGNLGLRYRRRILGSLRWGYLAAKVSAQLPTSPDTLGIRDSLGGKRSTYGLGLAYTYELPLLPRYHEVFARLPLVFSVALEDDVLYRDHDAKRWESGLGSSFTWGAAVEILPLDYVFAGLAVCGGDGTSLAPYVGVRGLWIDLAAAWHTGAENRLDVHLRMYL